MLALPAGRIPQAGPAEALRGPHPHPHHPVDPQQSAQSLGQAGTAAGLCTGHQRRSSLCHHLGCCSESQHEYTCTCLSPPCSAGSAGRLASPLHCLLPVPGRPATGLCWPPTGTLQGVLDETTACPAKLSSALPVLMAGLTQATVREMLCASAYHNLYGNLVREGALQVDPKVEQLLCRLTLAGSAAAWAGQQWSA